MTFREILEKKIEEIFDASDTMMPIQDIHVMDELRKLADEIDKAQEVMFRLPTSDRERIAMIMKAYIDADERALVFCGPDKKVLFMNSTAAEKYGDDCKGRDDVVPAESLKELRDAKNIVVGYYAD